MSMFQLTDDEIREAAEQMPEESRGVWLQMIENRRLQRERQVNAIAEGNWTTALVIASSNERAQIMQLLGDVLDDGEVRQMLIEWWDVTEAWSGDPELRASMFDLLDRAGPIVDKLPEGESFTLYRGNLGETPGSGSWTLDRGIAEGFARMGMSGRGMVLGMHRADGVPSVWRATITRDKVLGYFADRDEQEVVVNGDDLTDVELIAQAGDPE